MNTVSTSGVRGDRDWYLEHLTADVERFATAVRRGPLEAPISGCPDWDLRKLTTHMGVVHRWDAEHATGPTTPIDPELASDGIDEYLDLVMRHNVTRDSVTLPAGSLHIHCTDAHGEWLVSLDEGYQLERAHAKGAAALRGPAEALLLRLWNRDTERADELSPVGDESVLDAWLAVSTP